MITGGMTKLANNVDRNIYTDGNTLAERAINNNIVDFTDNRIKVSNQKSSHWKSQIDADLIQVDLGRVKSLEKNQVLLDSLDMENIPKGVQIIDSEASVHNEYDLVLVGRKLTDSEVEDLTLQDLHSDDSSNVKHYINKEIFHEADLRNVSKGAKKGEGSFKYFARNFYQFYIAGVLTMLFFMGYQANFILGHYYEDYVNYYLFYDFKRKQNIEEILQKTYNVNTYSK